MSVMNSFVGSSGPYNDRNNSLANRGMCCQSSGPIASVLVEQMTLDLQRSFRLQTPEIVNSRMKHIICDAYRLYVINVKAGEVKSATRSVFFGYGSKDYGANLLPNRWYLLILRPQQSVDLRCLLTERYERGSATIFVISVDFGFNGVIPVWCDPKRMFTLIATEGPSIRMRDANREKVPIENSVKVNAPTDSTVVLLFKENFEYEIRVEEKEITRDYRLQDPTTLVSLVSSSN